MFGKWSRFRAKISVPCPVSSVHKRGTNGPRDVLDAENRFLLPFFVPSIESFSPLHSFPTSPRESNTWNSRFYCKLRWAAAKQWASWLPLHCGKQWISSAVGWLGTVPELIEGKISTIDGKIHVKPWLSAVGFPLNQAWFPLLVHGWWRRVLRVSINYRQL